MKTLNGIFPALMLSGICLTGAAQVSLDRWVIGTCGGSATAGSTHLMYNVGEAVITSFSFNGGNSLLTQGFEQADENNPDGMGGTFYHGFTPNGDGKNDSWYIDSASYYNNKVEIYNRWGNKVWEAENYDNSKVVWEGNAGDGKPLPDGTYFYLVRIIQGTGRLAGQTFKGWVELTR